MNRLRLLILPTMLMHACVGKHHTKAPAITINATSNKPVALNADTVIIDPLKSKIDWMATEMRGLKKRTGKISLSKGYLLIAQRELVGGNFIVDMATMEVTDIPAHETTARKNLIAHLKSTDFFDTAQYPIATLALTQIEPLKNDELKIAGDLTIRGVTKNITFFAQQKDNRIISKFSFNRLDWKVAYTGSWVNKTLVDNDIELAIEVFIEAAP